MKADVYTRITDKIVADLEQGVRPWFKPWNAEHAAGRITRPLRFNGTAYNGINVLMLWASAVERGFAAPIWMTFRQAKELGAHVRKGEKGSLVVYANTITRTETDPETGEEEDRDRGRLCADATLRGVQGRGELLRHPRPRNDALDSAQDPAGPRLWPQALGR